MTYSHSTKMFPLLFSLLDDPHTEVIFTSQEDFSLADEIPLTTFFTNIIVGKLSKKSVISEPLNTFPSISLVLDIANVPESRQFLRYKREGKSFVLKDNFKLNKEVLNQSNRLFEHLKLS